METKPDADVEQTAELVMETVSAVTRAIRREMREHRPVEMSMQQFRALGVVRRHPNASLSAVAEHLGLTAATVSKLVDALVRRGLVTRTDSPQDRRKVVLEVTGAGRRALRVARRAALGRLAKLLGSLGESDRRAVVRAMEVLREALGRIEV